MGGDEKLFVQQGSAWIEHAPDAANAQQLSREHRTIAVEWSIHTAVDQIWIMAYRDGELVRELRYASGEGWTKRGKALPFENTAGLAKWLKKRRLYASPDGYGVLDAFLGKQPPQPVVDPGATYTTSFSPAHAAELRAIADRASVTVSEVVELGWHMGKRAVYDRLMARATKLGLDLLLLVDDTSPPPPLESLPGYVHEPIEAPAIEWTRYSETALDHQLALSTRMLAELDHMYTMFDVAKHDLLFEAYFGARARLVQAPSG